MEMISAHLLNNNIFSWARPACGLRLPLLLPSGEGWGGGAHSDICTAGENVQLPGVARRLVTFPASPGQRSFGGDLPLSVAKGIMPKPKVSTGRRPQICHLWAVPCVARLVRQLRNSHCVLGQSCLRHNPEFSLHRTKPHCGVLSPPSPEHTPLPGGRRGECKTGAVSLAGWHKFVCRNGI